MRSKPLALLALVPALLGASLLARAPEVQAAGDAAVFPATLPSQEAAVRLQVTPQGNAARYRIRERLASMELPYDAVGETSAVTGVLELDARGQVVPARSRIVVNVTGLKSDQERRDGFVQRRLLETETHPTVTLQPTRIEGLSGTLPTTGSRPIRLTGNLTVKGVTRPTTWTGTARFQNGRVTGTAATKFTFADFSLTQPKIPIVLSLADTIQLEYDFNLASAAAATTR